MRHTTACRVAVAACSMLAPGLSLANGGHLTVTPSPTNRNHVVVHVDVQNSTCQSPSQCDQPFVDLTVRPCPPGKACDMGGVYRSRIHINNDPTSSAEEAIDLAPGIAYQFGGDWVLVSFLYMSDPGSGLPMCFPLCSPQGQLNTVTYGSTVATESGALPSVSRLDPAFPNPFQRNTAFALHLSRTGDARVGVYDVTGRRVRLLFEEFAAAGDHPMQWDGRDDRGSRAGAGVYLVRAEAGGEVFTHRVIRLD